ncbi:flagellar basal body P-ring formation chaperone FlgA [Sphingomonas hengshuiensis]|uniref:Flagella basal body P-ring formation protein FlgA n=1 Tax=Sphingomonas hengshuiensis TaxID=1609977 RepID=A0A7U4J8M6_9SPHN|nr:flagellar basal body P-ring formation chaperone FlgA [Sphingomonas hengshuiensis]AJP72218.1 flagellar basal body P-ring biosynthesis protein FlgA [Sphingomonas hengshuiensis]
MLALLALALLAAGPDEVPQVAVLDHAIAKGERIERGDFAMEARPLAAARGALTIEDAAGMEAVRNLSAGAIVRRGDVIRPQLVRRGEPVTIRIVQGRLSITASGRALGGGAEGEMVRVVVNATSRTLDAMVEGSGTVRIATP